MGILFEHAAIVTGTADGMISGGHLLVEDGRISAVGSGDWVAGENTAMVHERVDATGCLHRRTDSGSPAAAGRG